MKVNTIKRLAILVMAGAFLTVAFNNCGKPKNNQDEAASESYEKLSDEPCEDQLMNFYSRSYQPFLLSNCSSCHSTGPGKGQIAHTETQISYKDFMQIGYSKVSANAISDGHNYPYSGSHHTQTVNDLKITWVKALSEYDLCLGGNGEVQENLTIKERATFALTPKTIPSMGDNEERRVEFTLSSELSPLKDTPIPNLYGAKMSFMIRKVLKGTDRTYSIHSPRLYGATQDIRVKGIFTKINSRYIQYSTNFVFADSKIAKNSTEASAASLVSTGALTVAGAMFPDDTISFDFELLEKTEIPPPPPPVLLSFEGVKTILAPAGGNIDPEAPANEVTFNVKLDKSSSEVVTFTYSIDTSPICNGGTVNASTCLPDVYALLCPNGACPHANSAKVGLARSVVGTSFNRFDWDYRLNGTSFSFEPGEVQKSFKIRTSKDIRNEENKLLTIRLEAGIGNIQVVEANSLGRIVYNKIMNPVPPAGQMTYSKLMNGGTLDKTCTECHNSTKRDGGYDVRDYELMISSNKQILVPGQDKIVYDSNYNKIVTAVSLMYRRTLPQFTPESLLMPRLKTLTPAEYNDVENWLTNGAKNN